MKLFIVFELQDAGSGASGYGDSSSGFPYLVVLSQDLSVVEILLYCIVDLCLLCRDSCVLASSETSMVFFVGSFRRERGHCYIGVYWWAVDMAGSWCILWILDWKP